MSQRKVCVVVNSRANYGRIKSFLRAASDHPGLKLQLVVGASALLHRFGKAIDIIRGDGFEPQAVVHSIVDGETPTPWPSRSVSAPSSSPRISRR